MTATSLTRNVILVLDGRCIFYFPDGKISATIDFSKGLPSGHCTLYYPNRKVYSIWKLDVTVPYYNYYDMYPTIFSNQFNAKLVECRDSTGNVTASNGNGHVVIYGNDFKNIVEEGNMVNDKKDGNWTGPVGDTGKFVITYHKGDIKSGISYMKSGMQYKFKKVKTLPVFSDGLDMFKIFVKKNTVYLESAQKRNIRGAVTIKFYVEPNGTVSNVQVMNTGLTASLNEEAIRVISLSPLWIPGTIYGVPTRMAVSAPVYFYPD